MMMIACLVTSATRMEVRRIPSYAFQDTWTWESLVIFRFNAHHIAALSRYASVVVTRIALTTNNAIGRTLHFPVFSRKFLPRTQVPVSSRVLYQPHRCVHLYQRSPQINPQCHLIPAQHQVSLLHFQVNHPSHQVPQISQP